MKKKWISILIFLILLGAGLALKLKGGNNGGKSGEPQYIEAKEGPIEETVDATGEVSPLNRVEIKPPIQGRVEQLLVDEGANLKAGQILAWMSSSDRAAILDAARDLFVTEGYQNVSIRKVAERIEYSPAAIYGYFPSKDDIFFALAEEGFRLLGDPGAETNRARLQHLPPRPRRLPVHRKLPRYLEVKKIGGRPPMTPGNLDTSLRRSAQANGMMNKSPLK